MKQQSRTLGFILFFPIAILGLLLAWRGDSGQTNSQSPGLEGAASLSQLETESPFAGDSSGAIDSESRLPSFSAGSAEANQVFLQILTDLGQCFSFQAIDVSLNSVPSIEAVMDFLEPEFGAAIEQGDRWMAWHLRTPEGRERRLRLEVMESDSGLLNKELHYYAVDRDGTPIPLELAPSRAENPSDEVIGQMLKEGEVFYKEKAGTIEFTDYRRVNFVEVDGALSELELSRAGANFKCSNLRMRETCACSKL